MKFWIFAIACALTTFARAATNDLTVLLQQGLFEEEANRDLNAAIANYQSLATAFDKDRQLAATAIFRLGECYRKLGKTNEATAQYQRILKEFADQPTLVTLSRQNLAGLAPQQNATTGRLQSLEDLRLDLEKARMNVAALDAFAGTNRAAALATFFGTDDIIMSATSSREALKKREADLLQKYLPENSIVKDTQQQIQAAQNRIDARAEYLATFAHTWLSSLEKGYQERLSSSPPTSDSPFSNTEASVASLQTQLQEIEKMNHDQKVIYVQQNFPNPVLTSLVERLNGEEIQLLKNTNSYPIDSPELKPAREQIESLKQKIDLQVEGVLEGLRVKLVAAQALRKNQNNSTTSGNGAEPATTDEEQQEIRRIQLMIQNSPDLINAPAGEGIRPTPLITAAMKGQLVVAKYLLDHGADVNGLSGNHGAVPLTAAAENGHKAMVELLLARGADVSGRGLNPFYLAVSKGYLAVAEVLLANKADVNAPSGTDAFRLRPVQAAARDGRTDLLQMLIQNGADVNVTNSMGETALKFAVANNNISAVKLLLAAKASIDPRDFNGETPLHAAAARGNVEMVSLLLKSGAAVDATNNNQATPLLLAVLGGYTESVRTLLQHKAEPNHSGTVRLPNGNMLNGWQADYLAMYNAKNDILKLLLDAGANAKTNYEIFDAISKNNSEAVQILLDHGVDPNAKDREGFTPLSSALKQNRSSRIVAALLEKGADPNKRDADGGTPLFHVQTAEAARLLIERKADVNATLTDGFTPLMVAQGTTNILELLLESGAKVDAQNTNGDTALHCMVRRPWPDAVAVLLKYKANPNIQNNAGDTPLDLAKAGDVPPSPGVLVAINSDTLNKRKIADLLVQAGGLANLPKRNRIEVRRASQLGTAFTKGSRDWNRYSLLEIIAGEYRLLTQTAEGTWDRNDGARWALWNNDLRFPDFRNIIIYRRTDALAKQKPISVNLEDILNSGDCSRDMWLEWGDVVEIPESDHPVDFRWAGLLNPILTTLTNCLSREVTVVVKGVNSRLKLGPEFSVLTGSNMPDYESVRLTHVSFMLRSVLDNSKLVRVSSDLSRVKVTRVDPETKKKLEWTIDCTKPEQADLWLRDGDVIEVPEK